MALTEEQRAKLNAKAQQKKTVSDNQNDNGGSFEDRTPIEQGLNTNSGYRGMVCPNCGGKNVSVQTFSEQVGTTSISNTTSKYKEKGHGILWWLCIGWWWWIVDLLTWIFMFFPRLIMRLFSSPYKKKKYVGNSTTVSTSTNQYRYRTVCTCQSCGYHWDTNNGSQTRLANGGSSDVSVNTPFYKRWWFILLCVFVVFACVRGVVTSNTSKSSSSGLPASNAVDTDVQNEETQSYLPNDVCSVLDQNIFVVGASGYLTGTSDMIDLDYDGRSLNMGDSASSALISALKTSNVVALKDSSLPSNLVGQHMYAFNGFSDESSSYTDKYKWMLMVIGTDNDIQSGLNSFVHLAIKKDDGSTSYWQVSDDNINATLKRIIDFYTTNMNGSETVVEESTAETSQYMTETDIASEVAYMFAVEVPAYQDDNFKAGTYTFTMKSCITKSAQDTKDGRAVIPGMFDIYVSDVDLENASALASSGLQPSLTVGGMGADGKSWTLSLEANKYVYVLPVMYDGATASGILHIELSE